jgi:glutamate/tyrosine decarboxylase-like PLP-dependent enzyme
LDLRDRIRDLERTSRRLEPDRDARRSLTEPVVAYAADFLDALDDRPVFVADRDAVERLRAFPIGDPVTMDRLLELFREAVDEPGLHPASGGHLAYIPGGGIYASALGDYLAAVTNEYAGIRFTGPGAVEMENMLLDWMADLVGYPGEAGGNLASGGSIANLVAVVTARDAHGIEGPEIERAVVYLTHQAHHCVDKALRVAGLGSCRRRWIPTDDRWRMDPEALDAAIREDREAGRVPWMVVASAGTTDTGAVDPLREIGEVARSSDLWYHVDAAYGGFFLLCPEVEDLFDGIELSDSVVVDPHKGLFLPYGLGAVLVRDREQLQRAHYYTAPYMQDARAGDDPDLESPAELSPELSKHFRGLRMWLPLMAHGVEPFRAGLSEKLLLTRYFHRKVAEIGFETGPDPELSVSTYRWVPEAGDPDAFNRELVRRVHEDGRVFLTSTRLDGDFVLRLAVLSFRTHLEHVDLALEVLEEKVAELEGR